LDHGERRLRLHVEPCKNLMQTELRRRRIRAAAPGDIGTGAKMLAPAAQDDHAGALVRRERGELRAELVEHGYIEGIATFRPVQRDRRHAAPGQFADDRFERHGSTLPQRGSRCFDAALQRNMSLTMPLQRGICLSTSLGRR
jgi:hypothetical protein